MPGTTNPVGTWLNDPNFEAQSGTTYKTALDNALKVARRLSRAFAPHEQSTPNMTVRLDEGFTFFSVVLTEIAAQSTGTITAPTTNPRIDRIVIDESTGTVSVIAGTEAASPTPPAITAGKLPVAQVLLQTTTTTITNVIITDERTLFLDLPARRIRETGGPTVLTVGSIPDGKAIKRIGTTLVGGGSGSWEFIQKQTASASAQIDFVLPAGYNAYKIVLLAVIPATDDVELRTRLSIDGGSSFIASAAAYAYTFEGSDTSGNGYGVNQPSDTAISVPAGAAANLSWGNAAGEQLSAEIIIYNARNGSVHTSIRYAIACTNANANAPTRISGTGTRYNNEINNAIRFLMETGNITSGIFVLYGLLEA
jgi:hypothetical protein